MRAGTFFVVCLVASLLILNGCGGGVTSPENSVQIPGEETLHFTSVNSHYPAGFWSFTADPVSESIEIVPLRSSLLHLNALPFLEPPVSLHLTVENIQFSGNTVECDVGIRNPFLGIPRYSGLDVCGIFITNGSLTGFIDPGIVMPASGDTRLLNPDGYSRWWNPREFPHTDTILGYSDGLLGTPDEIGQFTSTINGYKYFCDDLEANDPMSEVTQEGRGVFRDGQQNFRHYVIDLSGGLVFNYAVDVSWKPPTGEPPYDIPEDFPPGANRPEAWNISITETTNTLWNDGENSGGNLSLEIDVYDWHNADLNILRIESPGNVDPVLVSSPIGSGDGFLTYEVSISDATPAEEEIELLISVMSETIGYGGHLPGAPVTAYFTHTSEVAAKNETGPCTDCPWPMYNQNPKHTSRAQVPGPYGLKLLWSFDAGAAIHSSPVIGEDGTIYFGCADDNMYWLNPDGSLGGSIYIENAVNISSTPAIGANGWIYFGGSKSNLVIGLNPSTLEMWTYTTGSNVDSSPVISDDGIIYIHSDDNYLYALTQQGDFVWKFLTGGTQHSSPALADDGTIYIGENNKMWAVNPDGTLKWSYDLPHFVNSSPTVGPDGTIYFGCYDHNLYALTDNETEAILQWTYATGSTIATSTPAIADDGTIYINSEDHFLHAVNPDGSPKWKFDTGGEVFSSPAVGSDGLVYVGNRNGDVFCLNEDGEQIGVFHTDGYVDSSPAIGGNGILYIGSDDGHLYALESEAPPQFGYSSNKNGNYDVYLTDIDGSFETILTNHSGTDYLLDFSPDGSIAYVNSDRDGYFDIFAIDIETAEITNITHDQSTHQFAGSVSPDGEWIVTANYYGEPNQDLFKLRTDGSMDTDEWIKLTGNAGYEYEPDWSPVGDKIASYWIGPGNFIWLMDASDGGNKEIIIDHSGTNHNPKYSPEGNYIMFQGSNSPDHSGIFYHSFLDGEVHTYLDEPDAWEFGGSFSPDGKMVIFTIGEPGDIYYGSFPLDSEPIPLITSPGNDSWTVWRPMQ